MASNSSLGNFLKLSITGASHAKRMEFSLAGMIGGVRIDEDALMRFMERRAPGRDKLSTSRKEPDRVSFVSGISGGVTTGEKVSGEIASVDMRPKDYGSERTIPRPGHADFGQWVEGGRIPTGGGKNSGRLTAPLCAAGWICLQFLKSRGVTLSASVETIHGARDGEAQVAEIEKARDAGDSVGGTIVCKIEGIKPGLGGALFDGLESGISSAVFAIPGVKGIEFGSGFAATMMTGSEYNDAFVIEAGEVKTSTNRQGGILGGRSSGMPVEFRVAMRPTPTIFKEQQSVDLATMQSAAISMKGRHDPCIVRRALPVVEAAAAFAVADAVLADEAAHPRICLTLTGKTLKEDLAQYESQRYFTDIVELRADLLESDEREHADEFTRMVKVPVILTFRRKCDGGAFDGEEIERKDFFKRVLSNEKNGFAYVDFESDFRHDDLAELAEKAEVKIIRSLHDFSGPVKNVVAECKKLRGETHEIPKIAFMPKSTADVDNLFEETKNFDSFPHILCAMSAIGLPSRVFAGRTHSLLTYASVGGLGSIGHVSPFDLVRKYRIRSVTKNARIEYVPSDKVELTNLQFADEDEDRVALPEEILQ